MTISISVDNIRLTPSPDSVILDESSGVQTPVSSDDGNDVDVTLSGDQLAGLDAPFLTFLSGLPLSAEQKSYAATVDGASSAADFVKVNATAGETISDLYFSDANGDPLQGAAVLIDHDGDPATPRLPLETLGGDDLYLWSFGDYAIATTSNVSVEAGRVVAAFYLKEAADKLSAQVQMVTFEPLKHPDGSNPDDAVNFTDALQVSAAGSLSFTFDSLESGNFLWAAVGSFQAGLLVTGQDLNVNDSPGGKLGDMVKGGSDSSDSVNTSQGGIEATIGINAQHFTDGPKVNGAETPGPVGVFTLVTGYAPLQSPATPGQATGTNVKQIDYGSYINSPGAAIFISQTTSNGAAMMKISLWEAGGGGVDKAPGALAPEEGYGSADNKYSYIGNQDTDSNLRDDFPVEVHSVTIRGQTWLFSEAGIADGLTKDNITVKIVGNDIIVLGATTGDLIRFTARDDAASSVDGTFNRFTVQGLPGTADFDIGRVDVDKGVVISQSIGDKLLVEDDGPALSGQSISKRVEEDELASADGDQSNGITDGDLDTDEVNFTNADLQAIVNSGSDQPASFDLNLAVTGAVRDIDGNALTSRGEAISWSVAGGVVSAVAGGRTIFTITQEAGQATADPGDDVFRVDLRDQIDHPSASGDAGIETVNLTPAFTVSDHDGDGAALNGTQIQLVVENDVPEVNNNLAAIQVDEDAMSGAAGGDASSGIIEADDGDGGAENDEAVWTNAALQNILSSGADEPALFALNTSVAGGLDGEPVLGTDGQPVFSRGEQLFYNVNGSNIEAVAGNRIVFTITQSAGSATPADPSDDEFTFDLKDQIDHANSSGDLGVRVLDLTAAFTASDRDGDQADLNGAANDRMPIRVTIENDVPALSGQSISKRVEEDELSSAAGDLSDGITDQDGSSDEVDFSNADLQTVVNAGADEPASFALNLAVAGQVVRDVDGNALTSRGEAMTWSVSTGVVSAVAGGRTIFTIAQTEGGATAADPTDDVFRVDLRDQIDHPSGSGDAGIETVNITPAFTATDYDGDSVELNGNQIQLVVENDVPAITAQILDGFVEFAADDTGIASSSLNGAVGADDNIAATTASGGKQYIITSFTTPKNVYTDLEGKLSADGTSVTYYSTSVDADQNASTAVYELSLDQSGAGSYTFTVLKPPPFLRQEFDFTDLPSGQNLFGVIAADKQNLDGSALFVTTKNAVLNNNGTMSQTSGTVNTSKGGGPVTIGDSNQMYDAGEGAFFAYIKDADVPSIAGVTGGLNQNSADDADTVGFKDTVGVRTASVELVQVQGNDPATLELRAFDIDMSAYGENGVDTDADARAFVVSPEANAALVNITGVRVYVGGKLVESWSDTDLDGTYERQDVNGDNVVNAADDDPLVNVSFLATGTPGIFKAQVAGLTIGLNSTGAKTPTSVEFDTQTDHDLTLVDAIAGKYDIGGFNIAQGRDAPDQLFDFSVAIADYDGDPDGGPADPFANFSITVDGTGAFDDPDLMAVAPTWSWGYGEQDNSFELLVL